MSLVALVAAELAEPVDSRVAAMAAAIAAAHGDASRAVLFYGSCLREAELDGLMLDFYLIVSDYHSAYATRWLATANRLVPPNVFPFAIDGLAAKYAVLSEADFEKLNTVDASTVSVWARFAQPSRLIWWRDDQAHTRAIAAVATAVPTLISLATPLVESDDDMAVWRMGFSQTYKAELRAERSDRSESIVDKDAARYRRMGAAAGLSNVVLDRRSAQKRWAQLQRRGKLMSIVRLAKASLTFSDGIDYLAWKINRHAGTAIAIKPWQRRWPLLGAVVLVPRLFLKGAIK
jgi:hypothetical protein